MNTSGKTWAIVLAAGEGSRLRGLTTTKLGISVPKQFCSLQGGHSLLRGALLRAAAVTPPENIRVVVARQHKCWWEVELAAEPPSNVIVQPSNRGTANGSLLALLHIMTRDSDARVILLPSDHYVGDEQVLAAALQRAVRELEARREHILLLGIAPEDADPDLGYIVPGCAEGGTVSAVSQFVEKPTAQLARVLIDAGALWNAFIVAARAQTLLEVFTQRFPRIVDEMRSMIDQRPCTLDSPDAAIDLYQRLPDIDFSRHILQGTESVLQVLRVDRCGWSDLGTPARLTKTLRSMPGSDDDRNRGPHPCSGFLNLATEHNRQQASRSSE